MQLRGVALGHHTLYASCPAILYNPATSKMLASTRPKAPLRAQGMQGVRLGSA